MPDRKERQNVMIKPTHDCNMNCYYCFVNNLTEKYREQRLDLDTLNESFRVLSNTARKVDIIWHGGEPTLPGVQWYKDMIELTYRYADKTEFSHSMQTNGLTLDEDWADLAKNWGMDISVSFDGLYQDFRKKGTKDIVEKNLLEFKERVGGVGCLSVITEDSYKGIIDNYEYFKSLGISVSFNYGINPNYNDQGEYRGIPLEDYLREYKKYIYHWMRDIDGVNERSVETLIDFVTGEGSGTCSTSDCRGKWVNINPDGSTAHCNRYFPQEYGMGSIERVKKVEDLYSTDNYKLFEKDIEKRFELKCHHCSYLPYCNGGCQSLHLMNAGSVSKVDKHYCERFKEEFNMMYRILRGLDLNEEFINPVLKNKFRSKFTLKEIGEFLLTKGIDKSKFGYNPDNLLKCGEFKLYRIFNPMKEGICGGHTDVMLNEHGQRVVEPKIEKAENIFQKNKERIFEFYKEGLANAKG